MMISIPKILSIFKQCYVRRLHSKFPICVFICIKATKILSTREIGIIPKNRKDGSIHRRVEEEKQLAQISTAAN